MHSYEKWIYQGYENSTGRLYSMRGGKNCDPWLNGKCNTTSCKFWDHCTLMNDNALPPGTNPKDYQGDD
jgi:hypothetical protein